MNALDFINSIYLGDRGCKGVVVDSYNSIVKIKIDLLSRIRSQSGNWDYYNDENIENGYIVFTSVKSMKWNSNGVLPNDYIDSLSVRKLNINNFYEFIFKVNGCNSDGNFDEIEILVVAQGVHIETSDGQGVFN